MANLACKHYVDVGDVDDTVYSSLDDEQKKPLKKIMEELDAKRNSDRYDHGIWSFAYELEKKSEHAQFIKHDANYVRLAHLANLFDSPGNYKWKLSEGLMVMNRLQSINDVSKLNLSPYDIDPSSFSYSDAAKRIRDWK
jgi:hypothetical protein